MARAPGPRSGRLRRRGLRPRPARRQADLYVAGLLAKAGERPEMARHVAAVTAAAEVPLRPVEKKDTP